MMSQRKNRVPIVIREGKACGLMMTSGVIPSSVKGMSVCGQSCANVPFCPCRDENLSPITGLRLYRSFSETRRNLPAHPDALEENKV